MLLLAKRNERCIVMDTASEIVKRKSRNEPERIFGIYGDPCSDFRRLGSSEETIARICSKITDVSIEVYAVDKSG